MEAFNCPKCSATLPMPIEFGVAYLCPACGHEYGIGPSLDLPVLAPLPKSYVNFAKLIEAKRKAGELPPGKKKESFSITVDCPGTDDGRDWPPRPGLN